MKNERKRKKVGYTKFELQPMKGKGKLKEVWKNGATMAIVG